MWTTVGENHQTGWFPKSNTTNITKSEKFSPRLILLPMGSLEVPCLCIACDYLCQQSGILIHMMIVMKMVMIMMTILWQYKFFTSCFSPYCRKGRLSLPRTQKGRSNVDSLKKINDLENLSDNFLSANLQSKNHFARRIGLHITFMKWNT